VRRATRSSTSAESTSPGLLVDGFDVLAVKEGFRWAADYARANGPIFVEVRTYRYHGHSMSDPGVSYRSRDEVNEMRQTRDCLLLVRNRLLESGWATEADFKAIDRDARAEIQSAIQFAESSPFPAPEQLIADIQIGAPPPFIRNVEFETSIVNQQ
jgi:pyruvate dehydrogenase E1 component alpha subunit